MEARRDTERDSYANEKIVYTMMQKEVSLSILRNKEEKEMTNLFHIKIQNKNKIDHSFNYGSYTNLIASQ